MEVKGHWAISSVNLNAYEVWIGYLTSRFSIPDSRFSILDSWFSIPDSQFSILNSWFSILDSRFFLIFLSSSKALQLVFPLPQEDRGEI
jgi:hypothetical protein